MIRRKYFGTDGVRGEVGGAVINAEFALRLGYAAGRVLAHEHAARGGSRPQVVIGKDTRISGYMLESALEAGLSAAGIDVLLAGPIPTPAVAYLTRALRLVAGIVISASHNPYQDNGIKFFSAQGMKLPDEIEAAIEAALDEPLGCVSSEGLGRARRMSDSQGRYIEFCKSTFPNDLDLNGMTIVVDAAHGAAYNIAPHVFRELGAEVHAIGVHPDGFNINKGVGALHPELLAKEVKARGAQLGVALDGDADRLQVVDGDGRIYNGDELLYAILRERMQRGKVDGVVGTLMTNFGFERELQRLGVGFERANVGDRYVLELMQERGWLYGGESSGHLLCLDCHSTGDGIVAALQVLTALRRNQTTMAEWVKDLRMYPQKMINVPLAPGQDWKTHPGLSAARKAVEAELGGRGRILIRASGTEPKLRLMVEAEDEALAVSSAEKLAASLG
ncbi:MULTISPECIES: phosphoglucosamine mutase [Achromobacter]|jgi:phosphoglucosamine mutase|uniref:Phosphoglucosamine mutase n=2 Tax=Achromobacter TaxID=222 RepID=A0A848NIQ5_9BURK|nr:phosphoglucosamine mutase [Achromobacter ruhlandii]ALX85621.1 phosphoglucosamine mutase [Achromobacter denitrificans]MCI1839650.1 phosphoglucosamine mutase [Achromobacter ruhlandii]MCV6797453.1 phosphoglucosamine mutase [Achromobacter ruhlandii]MCV6803040.1 phosphoglucosamine mutase [Achromobacter ruhlandii]MCV6808912.1 phosphoglucosamine mutase [Achromobacter ruhlandii]